MFREKSHVLEINNYQGGLPRPIGAKPLTLRDFARVDLLKQDEILPKTEGLQNSTRHGCSKLTSPKLGQYVTEGPGDNDHFARILLIVKLSSLTSLINYALLLSVYINRGYISTKGCSLVFWRYSLALGVQSIAYIVVLLFKLSAVTPFFYVHS